MMTDILTGTYTYEKRSLLKTTVERLLEFHQQPRAMIKLTPPPLFVQVRQDTRTSLIDGELNFTLWLGPIPVKWHARHEPGPTETSFADRMLTGPMAYWRHEHIFEPQERGVMLIDRITLKHKPGLPGILSRLLFDGLPLRFLFFYRHWRTKRAVED